MEEGPTESFAKFKTFLNNLFIRRRKEPFNDNDFKKTEFEYIQQHLEELLPLTPIEEAQRIKIYFQNAYIFHLNNGLRIANIFPSRSLTPDPIDGQDVEVEPTFHQKRLEDGEQSSQQERQETQLRAADDSELYPQELVPEQSLLASDYQIQTQKTTGPLMQSTPLSAPLLPPGKPRNLNVQQQQNGTVQDVFIADAISQINFSPIPIALDAPLTHVQRTQPMSPRNVNFNEVSFLRNFANIAGAEEFLHEQPPARNIPSRTRKRTNVEIILRQPKKKMDTFDVFGCSLPHNNKTESQMKRSEQSFLYFSLIRGNQTYITSRSNTIIPEGERGHISLQRVYNLSNVLRAYASHSQNSVEQPVQSSQIRRTRSPLTPQGILRTSLAFTPLRGDISSFEPRMVIDQTTSFPTRSLPRQQPLVPIPERDSPIHIPLTPQLEEMTINEQATFSNLPREDFRENVEMLEGQSLQIVYNNDPSQNKTQQTNIPLNSSVINIQPPIEHEFILPLQRVEDQPSNLPGMISENFEINEELQRPPVDLLSLGAQQSPAINNAFETETRREQPREEQPLLTEGISMQLQPSITQDAPAAPHVDGQPERLPISWLEILRPRANLVYPPESLTDRRKRRKRRHRRPVILRSLSQEYINEAAVMASCQNQQTNNLGDLNTHLQVEDSQQFMQNRQNLANDLPENPLSPVARYSDAAVVAPAQNQQTNILEELNTPSQIEDSNQFIQNHTNLANGLPEGPLSPVARYSDQITQYPIQIEKQLKEYLELIKRAGSKLDYVKWEHFDCGLFNENDRFELYTNIFKQIIENNYVEMDRLYEKGTTKMEAAKGFRFILDLKTMGLIEIESAETKILGIRLLSAINTKKS